MRWEIAKLERLIERRNFKLLRSPTFTFIPKIHTQPLTPPTAGHDYSSGYGTASNNITVSAGSGNTTWSYTTKPPPELNGEPLPTEYRMDGPRPNGAECCVGCGRFYNPHVTSEVEDLAGQIEALRMEVLSPLENLALASDED